MLKKSSRFNILIICCLIIGGIVVYGLSGEVAVSASADSTCFGNLEIEGYIAGTTVLVPGHKYIWGDLPAVIDYDKIDTYYIAGNIPVLITVPHGGFLKPANSELRDRTYPYGCATATTSNDANTIELSCDLLETIRVQFGGKYPHMIINRLDRAKIDQNRDFGEDCNPNEINQANEVRGVRAWNDFHLNFRVVAEKQIIADHGRGVYIDLHGKPSGYGTAIDVGYHLTSTELGKDNGTLNNVSNTYFLKNSIRYLFYNLNGISTDTPAQSRISINLADLLRGSRSFGSILESKLQADSTLKSYHVSPSSYKQKPGSYYSGEYNMLIFTSIKDGSTDYNNYQNANYSINNGFTKDNFISGFQLETTKAIRDDAAKRKAYAAKVSLAIKDYLMQNYNYLP
jgi:hypothetical protein